MTSTPRSKAGAKSAIIAPGRGKGKTVQEQEKLRIRKASEEFADRMCPADRRHQIGVDVSKPPMCYLVDELERLVKSKSISEITSMVAMGFVARLAAITGGRAACPYWGVTSAGFMFTWVSDCGEYKWTLNIYGHESDRPEGIEFRMYKLVEPPNEWWEVRG